MDLTPPPIINPIPTAASTAAPPGANPSEQVPIRGFVAALEAVLREPRRVMSQLHQPGAGSVIAALLAIALVSAAIYGFVIGTFSGGTQLWAVPVKISAGLIASALICLPSLFIFATLAGSTARLAEVFGFLAGKLALTTILLIGFAPVAWVFSQSTASLAWMGALHLTFWAIAAFFGARFLGAAFAHLVKSRAGIRLWTAIYLMVALQMTTALRPLVGTADTFLPVEKKFFLAHWAEVLDESVKATPTQRSP